jgi:phosphoglycerate kinase
MIALDLLRFGQLDIRGRRVFLRADLADRVTPVGQLKSDALGRQLLPALEALVRERCKVVVAGHSAPNDRATPRAVAGLLSTLLKKPVLELGNDFPAGVRALGEGQVAVAPNLEAFSEERTNDVRWAHRLARAFDVYVCEALASARDVRASTVALPRLLPARALGPVLERDLRAAADFSTQISSPFVAVVGGSDLAQKAALMRFLVAHADAVLLGGVVANTFLALHGWHPALSAYESENIPIAQEIAKLAEARGVSLFLPSDALVARRRGSRTVQLEVRPIGDVKADEAVIDIGVNTLRTYENVVRQASTVLWNGALGSRDEEAGLEGTRTVLAAALDAAPYSGVVGEDSVELATELGFSSSFRWVARSGRAVLDLLAGKPMTGLESLVVTPTRPIAASF